MLQEKNLVAADPNFYETPALEDIEPKIRDLEVEIGSLKASEELLKKNHNALEEQKLVLQMGTEVYTLQTSSSLQPQIPSERSGMQELMALSEFGSSSNALLGVVAGVVKREAVASLERVIFRATRGNAVFQKQPIERQLLDLDAKAGHPALVDKTFFMVFFAGDVLREKVSKICTYFGATLYRYPDAHSEHAEMCIQVESRLAESEEVLSRANKILMDTLERVAACFGSWSHSVAKEKMIFDALNKCEFDIKRHVFVAEGWTPKMSYDEVVHGLMDTVHESGLDTRPIVNRLSHIRLTPPTFIPTTRFTRGFQALAAILALVTLRPL